MKLTPTAHAITKAVLMSEFPGIGEDRAEEVLHYLFEQLEKAGEGDGPADTRVLESAVILRVGEMYQDILATAVGVRQAAERDGFSETVAEMLAANTFTSIVTQLGTIR